jgi:hypothetical protein
MITAQRRSAAARLSKNIAALEKAPAGIQASPTEAQFGKSTILQFSLIEPPRTGSCLKVWIEVTLKPLDKAIHVTMKVRVRADGDALAEG